MTKRKHNISTPEEFTSSFDIGGEMVEILEQIKAEVLEDLSALFPPEFALGQLSTAAGSIEDFVKHYLREQLFESCEYFFSSTKISPRSGCVRRGEDDFILALATELLSPEQLSIAITPADSYLPKKKLKRRTCKLKTVGMIQQINVFTPKDASISSEAIIAISVSVIQTAYTWLAAKFKSTLSMEHASLSDDLYSYLRAVFANGDPNQGDTSPALDFGISSRGREGTKESPHIHGDSAGRRYAPPVSARTFCG